MTTNAEYRARARAALQGNWGPALLVALLASLPSLIAQVASINLNQPMQLALENAMISVYSGQMIGIDELLRTLLASVSTGTYIAFGLSILSFLLLPFLNLGFLNYSLRLLRGEETDVSDVLSRKQIFGKAIAQTILKSLKLFLWAILCSALLTVLLTASIASRSLAVMQLAMYVGTIAYMVIIIRAVLAYYMAEYLLADHPEMGAWASIRKSIDMMRGQRMRVLSLLLSFLLWMLLASLLSSVASQVTPLLGTTINMALQLVITVYTTVSMAALYRDMTGDKAKNAGKPEDQSEMLN